MQYLIDGHSNPHFRGLSLSDPDDEKALLELLSHASASTRQHHSVLRWRAAGQARHTPLRIGECRFVPANKTADQAIAETLARHKAAAKNIVLVAPTDRFKPEP